MHPALCVHSQALHKQAAARLLFASCKHLAAWQPLLVFQMNVNGPVSYLYGYHTKRGKN